MSARCFLLSLSSGSGCNHIRDVGRLHRLPYHPYQLGVQRVEISLVSELGGEGFQGSSRVVLPPVEPAVDEALDTVSQGSEQRCYSQSRGYDRELRPLPRECPKNSLEQH